mmetsp:Transcript_20429/g.45085  ORF Transcript_20429/g.45085 Transcript_20429/m.45085 type:complete len:237 (+) Transcript_20429:932-1642(+)
MVLVIDFRFAALTLEAVAARRASLSDAATKIVSTAPATGRSTSLLEKRNQGCSTHARVRDPTTENVRNQELLVYLVNERISLRSACTLFTAWLEAGGLYASAGLSSSKNVFSLANPRLALLNKLMGDSQARRVPLSFTCFNFGNCCGGSDSMRSAAELSRGHGSTFLRTCMSMNSSASCAEAFWDCLFTSKERVKTAAPKAGNNAHKGSEYSTSAVAIKVLTTARAVRYGKALVES